VSLNLTIGVLAASHAEELLKLEQFYDQGDILSLCFLQFESQQGTSPDFFSKTAEDFLTSECL
jgi:hypothetical protein